MPPQFTNGLVRRRLLEGGDALRRREAAVHLCEHEHLELLEAPRHRPLVGARAEHEGLEPHETIAQLRRRRRRRRWRRRRRRHLRARAVGPPALLSHRHRRRGRGGRRRRGAHLRPAQARRRRRRARRRAHRATRRRAAPRAGVRAVRRSRRLGKPWSTPRACASMSKLHRLPCVQRAPFAGSASRIMLIAQRSSSRSHGSSAHSTSAPTPSPQPAAPPVAELASSCQRRSPSS